MPPATPPTSARGPSLPWTPVPNSSTTTALDSHRGRSSSLRRVWRVVPSVPWEIKYLPSCSQGYTGDHRPRAPYPRSLRVSRLRESDPACMGFLLLHGVTPDSLVSPQERYRSRRHVTVPSVPITRSGWSGGAFAPPASSFGTQRMTGKDQPPASRQPSPASSDHRRGCAGRSGNR